MNERRETVIHGADDIARAVTRIAHEIVERNPGGGPLVIVGIQGGGVWIAREITTAIAAIEPARPVVTGTIDVSMYRDDIALRPVVPAAPTVIPVDLTGATVVLVDNVLYTGRTVRAALDALNDHGRPRVVQLAVIVDRGHRQLPIRPDYVGKNIPTHMADDVLVGREGIVIVTNGAAVGE